ncbi:MAG: hypothetical protein RL088_3758 [Verrucomicrobiota bacterium]|jgi:predicted glycoside hydrolase/deacetylase ChbG (UPF0249 family)
MTTERKVIVNADDFGLSRGVNRGIIEAHERGILTSTSLMVRQSAAEEAAEYARGNPRLGVGLHVDLGEWVCIRGHWMMRYEVVKIDDKFPRFLDEIRRQLDRFRALVGREPSHIDSHQHFHRREPVRSGLYRIAEELALPLREMTTSIRYCGHFYGQSGSGDSYPELVGADSLARTLQRLPAGITELGCHPSAEMDFESAYARERLLEFASLCDQGVRETVVACGIKLVSFDELNADERRVKFHPQH